jgi:hypothetical protein
LLCASTVYLSPTVAKLEIEHWRRDCRIERRGADDSSHDATLMADPNSGQIDE